MAKQSFERRVDAKDWETDPMPCRRLGTVILVPVAWVEREPLAPAKR